jgi:hypothetical protein
VIKLFLSDKAVHIQSIQKYEEEAESDMDTSELTICTDGLTECQINKGKELIQSYTDSGCDMYMTRLLG